MYAYVCSEYPLKTTEKLQPGNQGKNNSMCGGVKWVTLKMR